MEVTEEDLMEFSDDMDESHDDPGRCVPARNEDGDVEMKSTVDEDESSSINSSLIGPYDENDVEADPEDALSEVAFDYVDHDIEKSQLRIPGRGRIEIELYRTAGPSSSHWLQSLHVKCSHKGKQIGCAEGHQINRAPVRAAFHRKMEFPYVNLSYVAFEVFDRFGLLKKEFKEHPVRRGSGTWGNELDNGILFLIDFIAVDETWRRNGLGAIMAKGLMAKAERLPGGFEFVLVIPRWLNLKCYDVGSLELPTIVGIANRVQHQNIALAFFRAIGFRRIGASCCLGLATDSNHMAHQISSADDYDPEEPPMDEEDDSVEDIGADLCFDYYTRKENLRQKGMSKLYSDWPVLHSLNGMSDNDCVRFFMNCLETRKFGGHEWYKLDHENNNALHIAARHSMPRVCKWLVSNLDQNKQLSRARNMNGYTPLEALQARIEDMRVRGNWEGMFMCMSDHFTGYDIMDVKCLGVLQEVSHLSKDHTLRLKFGCTCGVCLSGFMSPRMKLVLTTEAKNLYEELKVDVAEDHWPGFCKAYNKHNTLAIMRSFINDKKFRQGYANLFSHIAFCLDHNVIPTQDNVLDELRSRIKWPLLARYYLTRGGNVKDALKLVLDSAERKDSICGDGSSMDFLADDMAQLPECRNDREFGCVARGCGFFRKAQVLSR